MKIYLSMVIVVAAILWASAQVDGASNYNIRTHDNNSNKSNNTYFPLVINIQTTRQIASQYASQWDILKGKSRRLNVEKGNNNLVQWSVMVHQQEQVNLLEKLQHNGAITIMEKEPYRTPHRQLQGINENFSCYRTIDETFDTLNKLQQEYPDLVTVKDIGQSWKNPSTPMTDTQSRSL